MFGADTLYTALNVSAITTLLDAYSSGYALFSGIIPGDFAGNESINYYMSSPLNGGLEYELYRYTINCRSELHYTSRVMAKAVYDTLNRVSDSTFNFVCQVLQTIPPVDETDNFNTPVEITIKKRG